MLAAMQKVVPAKDIYSAVQRLYSSLPQKYASNGYAFPVWHYAFETTRRCNLRCKMCHYIDWLENVPVKEQMEGELTKAEWFGIVDQIHSWSMVSFTGGESFVRKDFMDILTYASRKARTHLISNTTMMPPERAEEMVSLAPRKLGGLGFNLLGVSLEGPGERHDEIRRMKGAFERSITGIKRICEFRARAGKRCPMIHISTVMQAANVDVLHLMPQVCADSGADALNLIMETRMHDLQELGEVHPERFTEEDIRWPKIERQALADALERTEQEAQRLGVELRLPRMPRAAVLDYYDPAGKFANLDLNDFECRNAWNTLFIGRKGEVFSCWINKVGNLREHTLKEIWLNNEMRDFRKRCQTGVFAVCPGCCQMDHKSDRSGR